MTGEDGAVQNEHAVRANLRDNQVSADLNATRDGSVLSDMRRMFFADAASSAARYGINFDRIVRHLWQARSRYQRLNLHAVTCLDDLVLAVACMEDLSVAWNDLFERYERALRRCCHVRMSETESLLLVRRVFHAMRHPGSLQDANLAIPDLSGYIGTHPLRDWMCHQVLMHLRVSEVAAPDPAPRMALVGTGTDDLTTR